MNRVSNNRNPFLLYLAEDKPSRYDDHDDPIGFLRQPHILPKKRLCDKGGGSGALVAPGGGQDTDGLVVAGETVNAGLDQNEAELGVLVLAVTLKVLADSDGLRNSWLAQSARGKSDEKNFSFYLLDQEVKVLGEFGSEACIPISLSV
jgi:hypothetical protein